MSRRLLLATRSRHKVEELRELLGLDGVELVTPDEVDVEGEPVEDADTFAGNAEIKARYYAERSGLPTLADDSGLEVDALDGGPGVLTRRYAGPEATDADNNRRLLAALEGLPPAERGARYRCVLAFIDPAADAGPMLRRGTFEGRIATEPRGSGGFGYDPVFEPAGEPPGGRTVGQLSAAEKHAQSHRGEAARAMAAYLREAGWPEAHRPRVVVGGEALIDLIIGRDGSVIPAPGGGQYNAARALARLGGRVEFLGRIGHDWFGRLLLARLEQDGVGTSLVVETADPTTLVLAEIDAAGAAHYSWYLTGTSVPGLEPDDALRALQRDVDALHVGTLGLALEPIADSLAALVAAVPEATLVMVDPNCRPAATPEFERYQARMRRVLSRADVVKGSDEDFAYLALAETPEATARSLLRQGVGAVLVTQGRDVARAFCAGGEASVPVPAVAVVDTVGAGDTFGGAFLAWWLERGLGRDELADIGRVEEAVTFAVRAAAINCTRAGAEPPTREEMGLD